MQDSILIVGPGAIGGLLAAKAADCGQTVYLLSSSSASERRFAQKGLPVKNGFGPIKTVRKNIVSARAFGEKIPASAVFFCVKRPDLLSAIAAAKKYIPQEAAILFLQNGIGHSRIARAHFKEKNVVIGSCYFASERTQDGVILHHGGDRLSLAINLKNSTAVLEFSRVLRLAGWDVVLEKSEEEMLWTKLCLNAAINPIGTLAKAENGMIMRDPGLKKIALEALKEATSVARKFGPFISDKKMRALLQKICPENSKQKNSTLQDIENGRPTELGQLLGPLFLCAKQKNIKTPILLRMFKMTQKLESLR